MRGTGIRPRWQRGVRPPGRTAAAVAAAVAAATVAACGGGAGGPARSPSPPVSGGPAPPTGAAARAAVTAVWEEFFSARTPTRRRILLLEDGPAFARVLAAQARLPVATAATARVSVVKMVSPGRARVTYTILASGQPVLSDQTGIAVYTGGTWKVGKASYCRLVVLENGGSTSSLPAACRG